MRCDPNTDEPIMVGGRTLLHAPAKRSQIGKIINSVQVANTPTGSTLQTWSQSPLRTVVARESIHFYKRLQKRLGISAADAKTYSLYGDLGRAFVYLQNWGLEITQQGRGSDAEYWQDIVVSFKGSERGVAAVRDPRYVIRNRGVSSSSSG